MAKETYRGEVWDDKGRASYRLEPNDSTVEFRTAANDDPSKLAAIAKKIIERGLGLVFPTTEEIREFYEALGISPSQVDCMRAFTAEEQEKVMALVE